MRPEGTRSDAMLSRCPKSSQRRQAWLIPVCCLVACAWGGPLFTAPGQAASAVIINSAGVLVFTNGFGDVTEDGQVDVRDLVLFTHHLNGTRLLSGSATNRMDLNQDGRVNDTDRDILARMIAGRFTRGDEDFDEDELSNAAELQRGTHPFEPDSDHDGWLDGWEVAEGTNPLSATSQPALMFLAAPPVRIIFPGTDDNPALGAGGMTVARPPVQVRIPQP